MSDFRAFLVKNLSSSAGASSGVPEWQGWVVLGALVAGFAFLVWWLYFSGGSRIVSESDENTMSPRGRLILAALILLAGLLFTLGARWDELWHRQYGGFGDDFLWPPHLMIYGGLGLNAVFAGLALTMVRRRGGDLRQSFRSNPLIGLLGLIASYQVASIPSDALWHRIIGPDLSAWSLPHALLMITSSGVLLIGLALALSTRPRSGWRAAGWPEPGELVAVTLLTLSTLAALQFGVTEWEWRFTGGMPFGRPDWVYPVVVLAIGVTEAHLVLFATRRIGAATALAAVVLVVQGIWILVARATVPPGPFLSAHLLLVPPAVALDAWYARRLGRPVDLPTRISGAALYAGAFFVLAIPFLGRLLDYPALVGTSLAATLVLGGASAIGLGAVSSAVATWLTQRGRAETSREIALGRGVIFAEHSAITG